MNVFVGIIVLFLVMVMASFVGTNMALHSFFDESDAPSTEAEK